MTEQDNCPDLFFYAYSHTYSIFSTPERTFPYKLQVLNNFVHTLILSTILWFFPALVL